MGKRCFPHYRISPYQVSQGHKWAKIPKLVPFYVCVKKEGHFDQKPKLLAFSFSSKFCLKVKRMMIRVRQRLLKSAEVEILGKFKFNKLLSMSTVHFHRAMNKIKISIEIEVKFIII